jgi:2'-5' RNA ligase
MDTPAAANWFLALRVPAGETWEPLLKDLPEGIQRFAADDRHLTLAFLGACGEERALAAWRALAPLPHPPIAVTASGWRAMGPPRRPSAYALVLGQGREPVAALMAGWGGRALEAAGRPAANHPPLPHITLARPKRRQAEALRPLMREWMTRAPVPDQPFLLERLALYTWAPQRQQRLFRIVAERRLDSPESAEQPMIPA